MKADLSQSIRQEMLPLLNTRSSVIEDRIAAESEKQERGLQIKRRFKRFKTSLIKELEKTSDVKDIIQGKGNANADSQEEFWDIIFHFHDRHVGVVAFLADHFTDPAGPLRGWITDSNTRTLFSKNIAWRASQDDVDAVFIACDAELNGIDPLDEMLEEIQKSMESRMFTTLSGSPPEIASQIIEKMNQIPQS